MPVLQTALTAKQSLVGPAYVGFEQTQKCRNGSLDVTEKATGKNHPRRQPGGKDVIQQKVGPPHGKEYHYDAAKVHDEQASLPTGWQQLALPDNKPNVHDVDHWNTGKQGQKGEPKEEAAAHIHFDGNAGKTAQLQGVVREVVAVHEAPRSEKGAVQVDHQRLPGHRGARRVDVAAALVTVPQQRVQFPRDHGVQPAVRANAKDAVELLKVAHPVTPVLSLGGVQQTRRAAEQRKGDVGNHQVHQVQIEGLPPGLPGKDNAQKDRQRKEPREQRDSAPGPPESGQLTIGRGREIVLVPRGGFVQLPFPKQRDGLVCTTIAAAAHRVYRAMLNSVYSFRSTREICAAQQLNRGHVEEEEDALKVKSRGHKVMFAKVRWEQSEFRSFERIGLKLT